MNYQQLGSGVCQNSIRRGTGALGGPAQLACWCQAVLNVRTSSRTPQKHLRPAGRRERRLVHVVAVDVRAIAHPKRGLITCARRCRACPQTQVILVVLTYATIQCPFLPIVLTIIVTGYGIAVDVEIQLCALRQYRAKVPHLNCRWHVSEHTLSHSPLCSKDALLQHVTPGGRAASDMK